MVVEVDLSVVITFLRQSDTIMGCVESVLSQTRLPEQILLAGPADAEDTAELARVYQHEIDDLLLYGDSKHQHGSLRLRTLAQVEGDRVIFLNAREYLYPEALEVFSENSEQAVTLAPVRRFNDLNPPLIQPTNSPKKRADLTEFATLPASSLLYTHGWVMNRRDYFSEYGAGSLFTLAALSRAIQEEELCWIEEPLSEAWYNSSGSGCWLPSVYEDLALWLMGDVNQVDFRGWLVREAELGLPRVGEQLKARFGFRSSDREMRDDMPIPLTTNLE